MISAAECVSEAEFFPQTFLCLKIPPETILVLIFQLIRKIFLNV